MSKYTENITENTVEQMMGEKSLNPSLECKAFFRFRFWKWKKIRFLKAEVME